jgi:putative ATP-binding cassette transporter
MMKNRLIQLLQQETSVNLAKLFVAFVIIGVTNALVLVIVHDVTEAHGHEETNFRLLMLFILCVATFAYTKKLVNSRLTTHVQQAILQLRIRILDKVRNASLMSYEGLERSQLINALSENTLAIVEGAKHFGEGVPAGIMLVCSFIYVAVISVPAVFIVALCVAGATVVIWSLNRSIADDLNNAMHKEDEFLDAFHQFLDGFKELKMDRRKSADLFDNYLARSSADAKDLNTKAAISVVNSDIYTYVFFYLLLASMLFLLPKLTSISAEETLSITTILLFLLGNGTVFVQALPNITKTDVAIRNITRLEAALDDLEPPVDSALVSPWSRVESRGDIVLRNLYFSYAGPQDQSFSVHVDELRVKAGELLYIQGGNGSGKSTLLKLITGLYRPAVGTIEYGGVAVTAENLQHYRECFSIIFTDFHLFDRLYGLQGVDEGRVAELLAEMQLSAKTSYAQGCFRNLNLSTGQRKRLALLVALLEDRPLCVFDEVAADQDPQFRKYFYEVMLQNLKRQGRTIIAVTHDDRYFHTGDRVLKMEYGRLVDG